MIRGQKLIDEINNYFTINNKYPNGLDSLDQNDILNIYIKVFPNENINIRNSPQPYFSLQPYYSLLSNDYYTLHYNLGWSNFFVWEWLFIYDSITKGWTIGHMQYTVVLPNSK